MGGFGAHRVHAASRPVGAIDIEKGKIESLLEAADLDELQPAVRPGPRRPFRSLTADMSADGLSGNPVGDISRHSEIDEKLIDSLASLDPLAADAARDLSRRLMPFLYRGREALGTAIVVEARMPRDPLDDHSTEIRRLTLPGNAVLLDRLVGDPVDSTSESRGYGQYEFLSPPPPTVLLNLDTATRKQAVIAERGTWLRVLTDLQGRPRLALEALGNQRRFLYRGADSGKWKPLETILQDGSRDLGFTVTPDTLFQPRSVPLGFDYDGDVLYLASNIAHDAFALRALDTRTGRLTDAEITIERADLVGPTDLARDDVLVLDPHSRRLVGLRFTGALRAVFWLDAQLAEVQRALSRQLAPRTCEILAWNAARNRYLLDIASLSHPGGFHVFDMPSGKIYALAQRAPKLDESRRSETHAIAFTAADGRKLAGFITLPCQSRIDPPPVLFYFHDGPWQCDEPTFNRGVQALAALGFAVIQVNYRGSGSFGREHLLAIRPAWDTCALDDAKATLEWAAKQFPINPKVVATLGSGFGGYLAVRAAQLEPALVRCAVAINAPGDLEAWCKGGPEAPRFHARVRRHFFGDDREALCAASALAAAPTTTRPVLIVHAEDDAYVPVELGRDLYRALKKHAAATAYLEIEREGHGGWSERSTARLFAELGRFFNATIYNYSVETGPTTVAPGE